MTDLLDIALDELIPSFGDAESNWPEVLARAQAEPSPTRPSRRRLRLTLIAFAALVTSAAAGIAIAATLGAFDGISAANHPQTGADKLDATTLARLQGDCPTVKGPIYKPFCNLVLESTRLIGHSATMGNIYVVSDTRGDLCTLWAAGAGGCGPALSKSQPISFAAFNDTPTVGGTFVATGIALDDVASVSFTVGGKAVTAPVSNNVWVYEEPNSHATNAHCVLAHLADGSTVNPFPEASCPNANGS